MLILLILDAAVLSSASVQREDSVDWPFLLALAQKARRGSSLQAQVMVTFALTDVQDCPPHVPRAIRPDLGA